MNPLSGQAARAGGIGVAVFGVAFLGLQALQQAVGAFDPRTDVVVAIIIAVSAGTLTLDRLRTRTSEKAELGERQKALERAVLIWEPVPLKQVSPEGLGIFPTKPENGKQPKDDLDHASSDVEDWGGYVERDVDPGLRDALTMAPFVLVFGGPRSGKTRTVAQLARTVLGDALALVPRNAEGLEALLELRPQLHSEHVVLWLDSLERFAKVIDAKTLDSLAATRDPTSAGEESAYPGPPITVVATIREDTWDRLMKADGQDGEFAKAVAARARVFKVPAVLDPGREKAAAQRLYPRANLDQGIGAALAASGKEEELRATTPLRRSDPEPEASTQSPADAWLLLPAAACVLAALWVGASAAVNGGISKARQPTIGEQVAEIRSEGAKGSRVSDEPNPVDLHGSGQDSWVFSFRELTRSVADEIQIWDVVGGDKLEQRFTFQPNHPAVFQFRDPADLDGDGDDEMIGGYGPTTPSGELIVPFAVDWDGGAGEYRIVNLHRSPPTLDVTKTPRTMKTTAVYRDPAMYSDGRGSSVSGYPTQDFTVVPEDLRLVSGYIIRTPTESEPATIAVEVEMFDTQAGRPQLRDCNFPNNEPVTARDDPNALMFNLLEQKWDAVSENKRCGPVYK